MVVKIDMDTPEGTALKFDAGVLASAWLGVAQASGKDDERPALSRTMLVEFYEKGVRLVATDGYVLLTAWVPEASAFGAAPEIDESPEDVVIAIDPHGRGAGLMGHLRKLAGEAADTGLESKVTFRVGQPPMTPTETVEIEGLESRALIIDHPGREELALPLFEGKYPEWRSILGTHKAAKTDAIAINPEIIGRLARLGRFYAEPLVWRFGGALGAALLSIGPIRGAAMPMRWPGIDDAKVEKVPDVETVTVAEVIDEAKEGDGRRRSARSARSKRQAARR